MIYKTVKLLLGLSISIILIWCLFIVLAQTSSLKASTLMAYIYPNNAYNFEVTKEFRCDTTNSSNVAAVAGAPDGNLFTITTTETGPGSYAHWQLELDFGSVIMGDNVFVSVLSSGEQLNADGAMHLLGQHIELSLDGENWESQNLVWTCKDTCALDWHTDIALGQTAFRYMRLKTTGHHGSHEVKIDAIRVWDATAKYVASIVQDGQKSQYVDALSLSTAGWPTPNPIFIKTALTCPPVGQGCGASTMVFEIEGPRFYLLERDLSQIPLQGCFDETVMPNYDFSQPSYYIRCSMDLNAGQTIYLDWWVWVQPSEAGNLTINTTWHTHIDTYTDTHTITIPQANIKPLIVIPGFMGTYPAQYGGKLDPLLKTYNNLLAALQIAGYETGEVRFGSSLIEFGYDWRKPISETGRITLAHQVNAIKNISTTQQKVYVDYSQVDIIAHSMGGLVARAYAEDNLHNNQDNINKLITVASPHKGSPSIYRGLYGGDPDAININKNDLNGVLTGLAICDEELTLADWDAPSDGTEYQKALFRYMEQHVPALKQMLPVLDIPKAYLVKNTAPYNTQYPYGRPDNPFLEDLNTVDGAYNVSKLASIPQVIASFSTSSKPDITYRVNSPPHGAGPLYLSGYGAIVIGGYSLKDSNFLGDGLVPAYSANLKEIVALSTTTNIVERNENTIPTIPREALEGSHMSIVHEPVMIRRFVSLLTEQDVTPYQVFWNVKYQPPSFWSMAFAIITCSPVNTLVTDPRGRQIGLDLTTSEVVNEIPGASVSDANTEPHIILIPQVPGEYQIQSIGTNAGDYKVVALGIVENDKKPQLMGYITGTITISETVEFSFNVPSLVYLPIILK